MGKNLLFMLVLLNSPVMAQMHNPGLKSVADDYQRHYNKGEFDSIFFSFSASMQEYLPEDKTIRFLNNLKNQAGEILNREFLKYQANYATYRTTFEKGVFVLELSVDEKSKINGMVVRPFEPSGLPEMKRNATEFILPFTGAWNVVWGGDSPETNYHVENRAQKDAFDFVVVGENGKSYRTDGKTNADYYAFGKEIIAPCAGEVVLVVDGIKDNRPGKMNPMYIPGNTVILKTSNHEYLFFAHFKSYSIKVKTGDQVKQGQLLGLCGNSGNSSEPHLHFHVQNVADINIATGVKSYFEQIEVDGVTKEDHSPIKGETVQQIK